MYRKKEMLLGVFLDVSKAYDCLNHDYLLYKMEKYGIRENALRWFKSYLSDRKQRVKIVSNAMVVKYDVQEIIIGVPK